MLNKRRLNEIIEGFIIQRNVISALVYRELKTRVSQVKFGILGVFFWTSWCNVNIPNYFLYF